MTPLEFVATTRDARFYLAEPIDAARDRVHLSSGTELMRVRARGADAVASVRIAPFSTSGVTVRHLAIPCASLTLTPPPDSPASGPVREMDTARPIQTQLWLREQPNRGAFVEVDAFDLDSVRFRRVSRSGQMEQVESRWSDGSRIRGWIPESILRDELASSWATSGANSVRACAHFISPAGREFVTVAAGTHVFDRPAGQQWASVPTADVVFEATSEREGEWVRIVGIPGITDETTYEAISHAWVPRGAVTYP
jgi:hypothetical protein